jgi:hypothetical protein
MSSKALGPYVRFPILVNELSSKMRGEPSHLDLLLQAAATACEVSFEYAKGRLREYTHRDVEMDVERGRE